ncbi:response regulator [Desulfuribacillus alkaliarsenatis]|nr:response regulator transcription factor [Desulfuribacillus alkaliarsenatis]
MMKNPIKVFIVDDHSVVRKGLKMFLDSNDEITVCGEAGTLKEALDIVGEHKPDIVLLDYKLPDGDGITGCLNIKNTHPNIKIIILTAFATEDVIVGAIRAGADAYLLKDIEGDELVSTIRAVSKGKSVLDSSVTDDVFNSLKIAEKDQRAEFNLTDKEIVILDMLTMGKVNKEIASSLGVSDKTVRNYISKIFKKINVTNRTEAASFWIRQKRANNTN